MLWRHIEKMPSRGAFQCATWLVWIKLAASKTLLWRRQKIRGCRRHQKRIIPGWNAKKSLGQLIVLGPFNIQKCCFYSSLRRCMACAEDLRKIMRWKINKKRIMSLKFETTIRIRENQSNIENAKFVSIQRSKSIAMVNHFYKSTVCK